MNDVRVNLPQPTDVHIGRNTVERPVFCTSGSAEASELAANVLRSSGIYDALPDTPPDELRPERFVKLPSPIRVSYEDRARLRPGVSDSSTSLLEFDFLPHADGGISVRVASSGHNTEGKALAIEQAAGMSRQAVSRQIRLRFAHPGEALEAASVLDLADTETVIAEQARRSTFKTLIGFLTHAAAQVQSSAELAHFIDQALPDNSLEVKQQQAERGRVPLPDLLDNLGNRALIGYKEASPLQQTALITGAYQALDVLYKRPEWEEPLSSPPDVITFGSRDVLWGVEALRVQTVQQREPLDARLQSNAQLQIEGQYDLNGHFFRPERFSSGATIELRLAGGAVSRAHTEAKLGALLDEQLALSGGEFVSAAYDGYRQSRKATVTPEPFAGRPTTAGPNAVQVDVSKLNKGVDVSLASYFS